MSVAPQLTFGQELTAEPITYDPATRRAILPATFARHPLGDALRRQVPTTDLLPDRRLIVDLTSPHARYTTAELLLRHPTVAPTLPPTLDRALRSELARQARNQLDSSALEPRTTDWHAQIPPRIAAKLRGYQAATIDYALRVADQRVFLAADPGAGKTMVALAIVAAAQRTPTVVLCKPSLIGNWQDEIDKWLTPEPSQTDSSPDSPDSPSSPGGPGGPSSPGGPGVAVLSGRKLDPAQIPDGTDIVICPYSLIYHRYPDLVAINPQAVIADESHSLKGAPPGPRWLEWKATKDAAANDPDITVGREPTSERGTLQTHGALQLTRHHTVQTVLLLTATPAPNGRHIEYLSQLDLLGRLDEYGGEDRFVARYARSCTACWLAHGKVRPTPPSATCDHPTDPTIKMGRRQVPNIDGTINTVELSWRLRATTLTRHSQRQMYPQLPRISTIERKLPLSKTGRAEYQRAETEFLAWLRDHAADKARREGLPIGAAVAQAMRNAAGDHQQMMMVSHLRQVAARAKMDALTDWFIDQASTDADGNIRKTVVYAWHRDVQTGLIDELTRLVTSTEPWKSRLARHYPDGYPGLPTILSADRTSTEQIREHTRRFQTCDDEPFIVCSIGAGSEGHTLDAAYYVALVEQPWAYGTLRQIIGRVFGRASNPHGATLINLIGEDTIEEDIAATLDVKKLAQTYTLDAGQDREWGDTLTEFTSETDADAAFASRLLTRRR